LSVKVTEQLGDGDVKKLGTIFTEIANGLKAVSDASDSLEDVVPNVEPPSSETDTTSAICPDPTGKACQLQSQPQSKTIQPSTTYQYRRFR
jgi:hypothetical protein